MKSRCPTEEEIAHYLERRTNVEQRRNMEHHFARCKSRIEEFLSSRAVVRGAGAPADHAPESVTVRTIAKLKQKGLPGNQPRVNSARETSDTSGNWQIYIDGNTR